MAAPRPVFRLIYASRIAPASAVDIDATLTQILHQAIPRNQKARLTSLLIVDRGWFIQAIEGCEPIVRAAYGAIGGDARHAAPAVLMEREAETRLFPRWSLGAWVLSPDDAAVLRGYGGPKGFDPTLLPERALLRVLAVVSRAHDRRFDSQQRMMVRA